MVDTLLDSGTLGSSYASQLWVQEHPEAIRERRNIDFEVKFGDSRTSQKLKEEVKVRMAVVDSNGKKHKADIWCKVLDTGLKLIVDAVDRRNCSVATDLASNQVIRSNGSMDTYIPT